MGTLIGDISVLIAQAVAVRVAVKRAFQPKMGNLIMENDKKIVINFMLGKL